MSLILVGRMNVFVGLGNKVGFVADVYTPLDLERKGITAWQKLS